MTGRLGLGVVVLAWLLPALTWWQIAPARHFVDAFLETPLFLFTAGGLGLLGALLTTRDRWLGVFVVLVAAAAVAQQTYLALAVAHWVALGAFGVVAVRGLTPAWRGRAAAALATLGGAEVGYGVLQAAYVDPLWWGWAVPPYHVVHGTVGNPKFYGALLAITAPFAAWWALPLFAIGVVLSQSFLAALAATLGLLARPGLSWRLRAGAALAGVALGAAVLQARGASLDTLHARFGIWALAGREWLARDATWTGLGPGAWFTEVPVLQVTHRVGLPELFLHAHNEMLQLVFEGGLVGLACLVAWLLSQRRALWRSPYRGAALALGIESLGLFPFRVATVALVAVVVVGLATAEGSA